ANTAAAAISVEAALVGSAAARWIAGAMPCTADRPGACSASIGSGRGGPGSALAAGVIPPSSSATDVPTAAAPPANAVLIDDMFPRFVGVVYRCVPTAVVTATRTAASAPRVGLAPPLRQVRPRPRRVRLLQVRLPRGPPPE